MTSLMPHCPDHILVASPSPLVRQRVLESLRTRASKIELASGGAEALGHLEKGPWQALFLDRCLPDLNAEELCQIIQQRFPGMEVVLLDSDGDTFPPLGQMHGEEVNSTLEEMPIQMPA